MLDELKSEPDRPSMASGGSTTSSIAVATGPNRPGVAASSRRYSWSTLTTRHVLQSVLLAGIFVLNFFNETDPDLWWHLATGRYIVDTGAIPVSDPFSHTAAGNPWIIPEWLGEVTIYLLYALGGYVTALSVFAAFVTLTFWLILRSAREMGLGTAGACMVTAWAAAISWPFWLVRPHIVSFLFFALYLYLLIRSRRVMDRWLWLLPVTMVVWVNFHSAYVMGLMVLGLFLLGEGVNGIMEAVVHRCYSRDTLSAVFNSVKSLVKRYAPVAIGTIAGAMVNPEGPGMLLYPLTYTGNRDFNLKYVTEWRSPNFHEPYLLIFAASILLFMVLGGRRRLDWAIALPMVAVTLMSLQWTRAIAFYAVVLGPFLASRLAGSNSIALTYRPYSRGTATRLNWLLLAVCLVVMVSPLVISSRAQVGHEPRLSGFPTEGLQYIRDQRLTGNLFNTYHWGGYILWTSYPQKSVFIDGRSDMYGARIFEDYRQVYDVGPRWREVLDRYKVDVMLIEKGSPISTLLVTSGEWEEKFRGEIEVVMVRRNQRGTG